MRELEDVALAFDRACRAANVDYALVGGIAVVAWGQPRMTMDVDALVRLTEDRIAALSRAAHDEGLMISGEDLRDAIRERSHATAFDREGSLHVDIKIASTPPEIAEVEQAVDVPFAKGRLRIVRAEDTVVYKLKFGSDQDIADARSIIVRRAGKLDHAHMEQLARLLGVMTLLRKVQDDVARAESTDS